MSRTCSICSHIKCKEIEKAILGGTSIPKISKEFGGLSEAALRNHQKNHLSRQLLKAQELREDKQALDVYSEVTSLIQETKDILATAKTENQGFLALSAISQLKGIFELIGKMLFAAEQAKEYSQDPREEPYEVRQEQTRIGLAALSNEDLDEFHRINLIMCDAIYGKDAEHREFEPEEPREPLIDFSDLDKDDQETKPLPHRKPRRHKDTSEQENVQENEDIKAKSADTEEIEEVTTDPEDDPEEKPYVPYTPAPGDEYDSPDGIPRRPPTREQIKQHNRRGRWISSPGSKEW